MTVFRIVGSIAFVLLLGIGALIAYAATRPDQFRVTRSLAITAPAEKLFPLINDLHGFNRWNPYERKDPGKGTYTGAAAGVGAAFAWDSLKVGKGKMTITDATASERVVMRLDFAKPFQAHNTATFTIAPRQGGSEVTWTMEGPAPLITKVMDVVIGMDRMIGPDFEDGLRNLDEIATLP